MGQVKTDHKGEIDLRDRTSVIRLEGHSNSIGPVMVPIIARGERGLGDIAQNRVVTFSLDSDDPTVTALLRVWPGPLRRLGTMVGGI